MQMPSNCLSHVYLPIAHLYSYDFLCIMYSYDFMHMYSYDFLCIML
jgi:hypothetical protein